MYIKYILSVWLIFDIEYVEFSVTTKVTYVGNSPIMKWLQLEMLILSKDIYLKIGIIISDSDFEYPST